VPPYAYYGWYGWHRPWGFGVFGPFFFILFWVFLMRAFWWGAIAGGGTTATGTRCRRGSTSGTVRAHEQMKPDASSPTHL
jgi:hypothetical protein